jgi:hypothetical protein
VTRPIDMKHLKKTKKPLVLTVNGKGGWRRRAGGSSLLLEWMTPSAPARKPSSSAASGNPILPPVDA